MDVLARVICVLMAAEGSAGLFVPSLMVSLTEEFRESENSIKRKIGLFLFLTGAVLLWITRIMLTRPFTHWIVAVCGIYFLIVGSAMLIFPAASGRAVAWFYGEKKSNSVIGFFLVAGGIILYTMI